MRIRTVLIAVAVCLSSTGFSPSNAADNHQTGSPSLHRVDFRIEGASCVTCLRRIAKTMRETKGVLKADVSIYRPYWALAIYDAKTAKFDKLSAEIGAKEHVRFMEVEDKPITTMPLIVIPKVSAAQSKNPTAAAAVKVIK
jgi:hypothetical protein